MEFHVFRRVNQFVTMNKQDIKDKEAFYGRYFGQKIEYIPEFLLGNLPNEQCLFKVKGTKVRMSKLLLRSVDNMTHLEAIQAVYLTVGKDRIRNVEIIDTNLYGAIRYSFEYFSSSRRRIDDIYYWKLRPEVIDFLRGKGIYIPSTIDNTEWFTLI